MGRSGHRAFHAAKDTRKLPRPRAWLNVCHSVVRFGRYEGPADDMSLTIVKNATCTFCGCVCDDIELHADKERIVEAKRACILGKAWFFNHTAERLGGVVDSHTSL